MVPTETVKISSSPAIPATEAAYRLQAQGLTNGENETTEVVAVRPPFAQVLTN